MKFFDSELIVPLAPLRAGGRFDHDRWVHPRFLRKDEALMNPARPVTKVPVIAGVSATAVSRSVNGIELMILSVVRPSEQALTGVSDVPPQSLRLPPLEL